MSYSPSVFIHEKNIVISAELQALLNQASETYAAHFDGSVWYGRCIFTSWYCSLADCKFCYRAVPVHQAKHAADSKRSMASVLLEALFCRIFGWRIEFLTAGYGSMPFEEMLTYIKNTSLVYGEKMWLNLGVMSPEQLELCKPYVEGICGSIETPTEPLHTYLCPRKPLKSYEKMFDGITGTFKKSAALIMGFPDDDIEEWLTFIEKHNLDRITVYALKPVRGLEFKEGPTTENYITWLAKLRIRFPKLEIIGGTNLRRSEEVALMLKAGVNAFTKFPATKQFGTKKAELMEELIANSGRKLLGTITTLPDVDWDKEIDLLDVDTDIKEVMKEKIKPYLERFRNPLDKDPLYSKE